MFCEATVWSEFPKYVGTWTSTKNLVPVFVLPRKHVHKSFSLVSSSTFSLSSPQLLFINCSLLLKQNYDTSYVVFNQCTLFLVYHTCCTLAWSRSPSLSTSSVKVGRSCGSPCQQSNMVWYLKVKRTTLNTNYKKDTCKPSVHWMPRINRHYIRVDVLWQSTSQKKTSLWIFDHSLFSILRWSGASGAVSNSLLGARVQSLAQVSDKLSASLHMWEDSEP